jgi:ribosome-binding factor A
MKTSKSSNGPRQRQLRVGELVRHALAGVFRNGAYMDGKLDTRLLTITEVKMSNDLKIATVYVMPLGGENLDNVTKTLAQHVKVLRGELGHQLDLKFTPDLRFLIDESFSHGARIDALLRTPAVQRDISSDENNS